MNTEKIIENIERLKLEAFNLAYIIFQNPNQDGVRETALEIARNYSYLGDKEQREKIEQYGKEE